jgi:hypothetical protein
MKWIGYSQASKLLQNLIAQFTRSHDPSPAGQFLVECDRYVFLKNNIVLHELRVKKKIISSSLK